MSGNGGFVLSLWQPFTKKPTKLMKRTATVARDTLETQIKIAINLDGTGKSAMTIGIPFLQHMLEQVARHGLIDIDLTANGDLQIDDHHTVEDIGITFGKAFKKALGDKRGIVRYGAAIVPLDEALSRVVIDFSGRAGLFYRVEYPRATVGGFDVDLFGEFFRAFANHAEATLHIDNLKGSNAHHIAETIFKAFARACRTAIAEDPRMAGVIPSSKGSLG